MKPEQTPEQLVSQHQDQIETVSNQDKLKIEDLKEEKKEEGEKEEEKEEKKEISMEEKAEKMWLDELKI